MMLDNFRGHSTMTAMKTLSFLIVLILPFFIPSLPAFAENVPDGMVAIPRGCFMMGTENAYEYEMGRKNDRERPVHKVCIDPFYLDKYEVRQKDFSRVMGVNRSWYQQDDFPVEHAQYKEDKSYCHRVGKRLPTEAEWEYAARAGSNTDYPGGTQIDGEHTWSQDNSFRKPHPVGSKKPNKFGVHDMLGSVWEWVNDWYSDHYYENSPVNNPKGPQSNQSWKVIRGGSWIDGEDQIRVTVRYRGDSDGTVHFLIGFRCARDLNPKKK